MKVRLQMIIESDDGEPETVEEIGRLERGPLVVAGDGSRCRPHFVIDSLQRLQAPTRRGQTRRGSIEARRLP